MGGNPTKHMREEGSERVGGKLKKVNKECFMIWLLLWTIESRGGHSDFVGHISELWHEGTENIG